MFAADMPNNIVKFKDSTFESLVERNQARIPKNDGGSGKYQTPFSSSLSEILLLSPMNSFSVINPVFSFLNRLLKSLAGILLAAA
jgi:hypothetical protein